MSPFTPTSLTHVSMILALFPHLSTLVLETQVAFSP